MSSKVMHNIQKRTKLGSQGLAHYVLPLILIVAVAISGSFWTVASMAATPVQKTKNVKVKVVIRNLVNCHVDGRGSFKAAKSGADIYTNSTYSSGDVFPSNKCVRVKNNGKQYFRVTMTYKFSNVPVLPKEHGKYPSYKYTISTYPTDYREPPFKPDGELKFQNPQHSSGYSISLDDGYKLESPTFRKFKSSYAVNLEHYVPN